MSKGHTVARCWTVAATGLLAVAGCSSHNVSSEQNSAVPIPAGATVQFRGQTTSGAGGSDVAAGNTVHRYIQQAIVAQLKAKGYTVVDTTTPATFTIRYFLAVKSSATSYGQTGGGVSGPPVTGYGLGYGRTQETQLSSVAPPEPVKNVSFEAALVDERGGRTAWRGMLETEPKGGTPTEERVNSLVADVFKSLPRVP
jgi:hypothetical protein